MGEIKNIFSDYTYSPGDIMSHIRYGGAGTETMTVTQSGFFLVKNVDFTCGWDLTVITVRVTF